MSISVIMIVRSSMHMNSQIMKILDIKSCAKAEKSLFDCLVLESIPPLHILFLLSTPVQ